MPGSWRSAHKNIYDCIEGFNLEYKVDSLENTPVLNIDIPSRNDALARIESIQ